MRREIRVLTPEELDEGEKHNPFLAARAVKVCKGQIKGADGKQKKDFRPKKGKTRSAQGAKPDIVSNS